MSYAITDTRPAQTHPSVCDDRPESALAPVDRVLPNCRDFQLWQAQERQIRSLSWTLSTHRAVPPGCPVLMQQLKYHNYSVGLSQQSVLRSSNTGRSSIADG